MFTLCSISMCTGNSTSTIPIINTNQTIACTRYWICVNIICYFDVLIGWGSFICSSKSINRKRRNYTYIIWNISRFTIFQLQCNLNSLCACKENIIQILTWNLQTQYTIFCTDSQHRELYKVNGSSPNTGIYSLYWYHTIIFRQ